MVRGSVTLLALLAPLSAFAQEQFLFFGDSLVDNRNSFVFTQRIFGGSTVIPASPPYFEGRFSNGPNWTDRLAPGNLAYADWFFSDPACSSETAFDAGLCDAALDPGPAPGASLNFAFGGARSDSQTLLNPPGFLTVSEDFERYVTSGRIARPDGAMIGLWVGGNDVSAWTVATLAGTETRSASELASEVVDNIEAGLTRLAALGPDRALVLTLEDLSKVPTFLSQLGDAGAALAGGAGAEVNAELQARLPGIAANSGLEIIPVDTGAMYEAFFAEPALFGFTNLTLGCIEQGSNAPTGACDTPAAEAGTLYWDGTHPTTTAHGLVAELVGSTLQIVDTDPGRVAVLVDSGLEQAALISDSLADHIAGRRHAPVGQWAAFAALFHGSGERDGAGGFAGYEHDAYGGLAGIDGQFGDADRPFLVGGHVAAVQLEGTITGGGGFDSRALALGGFAATRIGRIDLDWQITGLHLAIRDWARPTGFSALPLARGDTDGWGLAYAGRASVTVGGFAGWSWRPFIGLQGAHVSLDGFAEEGARFLNLAVDEAELSELRLALGIELSVGDPAARFQPYIDLAYSRDLLDDNRTATLRLPSGLVASDAFDAGVTDRFDLALGAGYRVSEGLQLSLGFDGRFGLRGDDRRYVAPRLSLTQSF